MFNKRLLAILVAGFCLMVMVGFTIYVPSLAVKKEIKEDEGFKDPIPTSNPKLMADQLKTRGISKVARALPADHDYLQERYNELPPMTPRTSDHVSEEDLARMQAVYDSALAEFREFKKQNMDGTPGIFRVFALVGMIDPFLENAKLRAFVSVGIREEEFNWILARVMEAGAFCVEYQLNHGKLTAQQQERLLTLRRYMFDAAGVNEAPEEGADKVFNPEKWKPNQIPRSNIELFLKHSRDINYVKIHPKDIDFDQAGIMAAAANNPP